MASVALLGFVSAQASAQDAPTNPGAYVGGSTTIPTQVENRSATAPESEVLNSEVSAGAEQVQGSALAFTGSDTLWLVGIGGAAILFGVLMVAARRRTQQA